MRRSEIILTCPVIFCVIFSAGCVSQNTSREAALSDALKMISLRLNDGAGYVREAADDIGNNNTDAASSRQILADLYQKSTLARTILYADKNMIVISVYPDIILSSTGTDQTSYGTNETYFAGRNITLTDYLHLDDGTNASVLSAPVYTDGKWNGYVSMSFDSSRLFGDVEQYLSKTYGSHLLVTQTDGVHIYDYDLCKRGKNMATDPAYADDVHAAALLIMNQTSGTTGYTYQKIWSDEFVQKTAVWDTLEFGGQTWQVIILSE